MNTLFYALCALVLFFLARNPATRPLVLFPIRIVLYVIVGIVVLLGTIVEMPRRRKIARGEAPYELPFVYRINGWQLGSSRSEYGWRDGIVYDFDRNKVLAITRRNDALIPLLLGR